MTFANVGTLGAVPGERDELVAHLTARNTALQQVGCLAYEVGVSDDEPDTVFVLELWESAEAHQSSLALPEVQAAITAARPLLSGAFGGSVSRLSVLHSGTEPKARSASVRGSACDIEVLRRRRPARSLK